MQAAPWCGLLWHRQECLCYLLDSTQREAETLPGSRQGTYNESSSQRLKTRV